MFDQPTVFVDLETTGGSIVHDRITEIGIIEVGPAGVSEWSTLVNPWQRIPPFIEKLTGISNQMVSDAPGFADLASEVLQRLAGRLFVAHNARFDYGFLKNEFKRVGITFHATVACSVKLSRRLFPGEFKHNLDSIIARHQLPMVSRHRALADARAVWLFVEKMQREQPVLLQQAFAEQVLRPSLPEGLDADSVDALPELPGVYLFYADNDVPLYVGKSVNLRRRVLQHFRADLTDDRERELARQVTRLDWIETAGELGALLQEIRLIRQLQPVQNRRLRGLPEGCSWQLVMQQDGFLLPCRLPTADPAFASLQECYGLYASAREASNTLRKLADLHQLCLIRLGLEAANRSQPRPCSACQLKRCRGTCIGHEPAESFNSRLLAAIGRLRLRPWPFPGPIGIRETDALGSRTDLHLLDRWCYLGSVSDEAAVFEVLRHAGPPAFDADVYRLLNRQGKWLDGDRIVSLGGKVPA